MRSVAILFVVIHHGFNLFYFPFIPLPDGVDIFFVLSGFLIGGILIKNMERRQGFSWPDMRSFWLRRWFRTLPAFWVALLLNLALRFFLDVRTQPAKQVLKDMFIRDRLWEYFFFIQNLFGNLSTGFFGESWSLSVEEWFYLLLPICLFILLKIGVFPAKAVLVAILLLIIGPTAARYFLSDIHQQRTWMLTRMVVIMRLDAIGFGVLMAYINYYIPALWNRMAASRLLLIAGVVLCYISFLVLHENQLYFNSISLTNLLFYPFTSFFAMITIPALSRMNIENESFRRIVTFISTISYSMYLLNYSFITQLIQTIAPADITETGKFITYLIFWASTIGFATILYTCIERPFMRLRDRYVAD